MLLSQFIIENIDAILSEWEMFARTIPEAAGMDTASLRDEAAQILTSIVHDMECSQTPANQEAKSKGKALRALGASTTAAETHGSGRLDAGFSLNEMMSEFRALRATVIRLWTRALSTVDGDSLYDLIRFNEGIDQALSESVADYTATRERSREIFLGVLGHDLRTPISVVLMSTRFMMERGKLESPDATAASRVLRSGTRIQNLVRELLDVAHIRLGGSLPIEPKPVDLATSCHEVIDEMRALHPQLSLILNMSGDLSTSAQASRIEELLSNLVQNAIQHGNEGTPIIVSAHGEQERILLTVHNEGPAIPESARQRIFEPLVTTGYSQESKISGSLGLGLYIAREIATAHHGSIDVESSNVEGTSFIVILPRH